MHLYQHLPGDFVEVASFPRSRRGRGESAQLARDPLPIPLPLALSFAQGASAAPNDAFCVGGAAEARLEFLGSLMRPLALWVKEVACLGSKCAPSSSLSPLFASALLFPRCSSQREYLESISLCILCCFAKRIELMEDAALAFLSRAKHGRKRLPLLCSASGQLQHQSTSIVLAFRPLNRHENSSSVLSSLSCVQRVEFPKQRRPSIFWAPESRCSGLSAGAR